MGTLKATLRLNTTNEEIAKAKAKVVQNILDNVDDKILIAIKKNIDKDSKFLSNLLNNPIVKLKLGI